MLVQRAERGSSFVARSYPCIELLVTKQCDSWVFRENDLLKFKNSGKRGTHRRALQRRLSGTSSSKAIGCSPNRRLNLTFAWAKPKLRRPRQQANIDPL